MACFTDAGAVSPLCLSSPRVQLLCNVTAALEFHTQTISLKGKSFFRVPEVPIECPVKVGSLFCIRLLREPQDLTIV